MGSLPCPHFLYKPQIQTGANFKRSLFHFISVNPIFQSILLVAPLQSHMYLSHLWAINQVLIIPTKPDFTKSQHCVQHGINLEHSTWILQFLPLLLDHIFKIFYQLPSGIHALSKGKPRKVEGQHITQTYWQNGESRFTFLLRLLLMLKLQKDTGAFIYAQNMNLQNLQSRNYVQHEMESNSGKSSVSFTFAGQSALQWLEECES